MNPAWSVILFTVSSGAGLGVIFWLAMSRLAHDAPPTTAWWTAAIIGVALLTIGLLASTRHLANPKNAWRAFSRFATSWLSREGVFAVALYAAGALYALTLLGGTLAMQRAAGLLVMALALAVLISTAMIYACLKTIPRWHNWQTRFAYPLMGLYSGAMILVALIPAGGQIILRWIALAVLIATALVKFLYYRDFSMPTGPVIDDALSLKQGKPRLLDLGHTHPNFLMREFGYQLDPARARRLRWLVGTLGFVVPAVVLVAWPAGAAIGALSCLAGLAVERWLFFAEARHVVRLYHGEARV